MHWLPELISRPLRRHWTVLLVFALPLLLPFGRLEELPLLVMAVLGGRRLWREGWALAFDPRVQLLSALFLAYWLPIFFSAFDAVHPEKTWLVTAAMPRYWLAGLFVLGVLESAEAHLSLWRLSAWLLVFWSVDALVQSLAGYNLLGYPHPVEPIARVNGVFGQGNYKLGPILALFSPLLVEHARRYWSPAAMLAALAALAIVVLLTTTRVGWVMLGVIGAAYALLYGRRYPLRTAMVSGVLVLAALVCGTVAYQASDPFRDRVASTMRVFDGTREALDEALSARLPIWETSVAMASEHWINGVGARGYRYAYPAYAPDDDPWVRPDDGIGATYAHHLLLEILTETGVIGLAGFALLLWLMIAAWRRAPPDARGMMFPYALALVAAVFPFNSHYAMYATGWSITLWWLVFGFCAAMTRSRT